MTFSVGPQRPRHSGVSEIKQSVPSRYLPLKKRDANSLIIHIQQTRAANPPRPDAALEPYCCTEYRPAEGRACMQYGPIVVDVQMAITCMESEPVVILVVDGAQQLPSEIVTGHRPCVTVSGKANPVWKVEVIPHAEQRIGPA